MEETTKTKNKKLKQILDLVRENETEVIARELNIILNNDDDVKRSYSIGVAFSISTPSFVIAQEFEEWEKNEDGKYEVARSGVLVKLFYNYYILELYFYDSDNDSFYFDYHVDAINR